MTQNTRPPISTTDPPEAGGAAESATAATARTIARLLALCVGSLAVMAPWPFLAYLATRSLFDSPDEVIMLLGGVTGLALLIFAFFGMSNEVFKMVLLVAWVAAAIVPDFWLGRRPMTWKAIGWLLAAQAAFSFAQAALGGMVILGKSV